MRPITAIVLALAALGCNPSSESACEGYLAHRERNHLSAGSDIKSKCIAMLDGLKGVGEAYPCASKALDRARDGGEVAGVEEALWSCAQWSGNLGADDAKHRYGTGIAGDYDPNTHTIRGAAAATDSGFVPMSESECDDVALWILKKNIDEGRISDASAGESLADGARADCLGVKDTPESGKYRCARLRTTLSEIDGCLGG